MDLHFVFTLITAVALTLTRIVPGWAALLLGISLSFVTNRSLPALLKPWNSRLLGFSIVLLSGQTHLPVVLQSARDGILISAFLIGTVLMLARFLGPLFRIEHEVATLIGCGTAICGGSAIAATAPAIGAQPPQVGIAIAVVFLLNALAVLIFPPLGHHLGLDAQAFGEFAALAIHDTSSVVAASLQFGQGAELTAVPMKLARALWIVPVATLLGGLAQARNPAHQKQKFLAFVPWFIPLYLLGAAVMSTHPEWSEQGALAAHAGKALLIGTLFLIGHSVSKENLKKTGASAFLFGSALWVFTLLASWTVMRLKG